MANKSLSERMKAYEQATQVYLPKRLPVLARIDGNHFSSFTKDMDKPFDERFTTCMNDAMNALFRLCDGCVFAYVQSDEISLVLRNDQTFNTEPWLGNRTDKLISHMAAIATLHFYAAAVREELLDIHPQGDTPTFDARVWIVPPAEVTNYFIHRQQDCVRNSVSAAAHFELKKRKKGVKLLHGKNIDQQQEILFQECGINWAKYPSKHKNGRAMYRSGWEALKEGEFFEASDGNQSTMIGAPATVNKVILDEDLPKFSSNRDFIERHLIIEDE